MPLNGRPDPDPGYSSAAAAAMATARWRLTPPAGPQQTIIANGRQYSASPGAVLTVEEGDAQILMANGWGLVALAGPTSSRPPFNDATARIQARPGLNFYDETLGQLIVAGADGAWRDPSGASV